ncbi:T4O12.16 [Arabidopsis thaliana]|uniref:T4O12.16 n=1 Tax=Arabidopsis thaliana TaxID=3702 RepID=Q9LQS2_ARATH|nr:T4O12.16 [Arabidopsis thaliana]
MGQVHYKIRVLSFDKKNMYDYNSKLRRRAVPLQSSDLPFRRRNALRDLFSVWVKPIGSDYRTDPNRLPNS